MVVVHPVRAVIDWYSGFILFHRCDESLRGLGKMTGKEEGGRRKDEEGRKRKAGRKKKGRRKEEERNKKGIRKDEERKKEGSRKEGANNLLLLT